MEPKTLANRASLINSTIDNLILAIADGEVRQFLKCLSQLDRLADQGGWARAFDKISRLNGAPESIKDAFVHIWVAYGDHIRQEIDRDLILAKALWVLLPRYVGPSVQVYRGDSAFNHRQRTYGLSWSSRQEIAEHFALWFGRAYDGGGVLLATKVPPSAIICSFDQCGIEAEGEFLIDRRHLRKVHVLKKFPQLPLDELDALFEKAFPTS